MPRDMTREPCPERIIDDLGASFGMGVLGGYFYHFARGLYHSPNGHRLAGGATAARMNARRVGGGFAAWGGLYSTFDCALVYVRRKEDPWNSIVAGAATGGILSVRHGLLAIGTSAIAGGVLLALIEGAGIMGNRMLGHRPPEGLMQAPDDQQAGFQPPPGFLGVPVPQGPPIVVQERPVPESGATGGWFSGWSRKKKDKAAGGDRKQPEMLELDLPSTAVPSFDFK